MWRLRTPRRNPWNAAPPSGRIRAMATPTTQDEQRPTDAPRGAVDRFFKITERGSTVGTEVRGGLVTFFTMSYIIVLNPLIIGTVQDNGFQGGFLGGGSEQNLAAIAATTA